MIYLYTGLNGTGKTSNVLWMFLKSKEYKDRPKYATFIKGFDYEANGVTFLDADALKKWNDLPVGSLIMVDEAQDFFPISRGEPEEWIKGLAKNRHFGYDFLLTTPDASMINHYVRKLVNRHTHFIMKHGALVKALKWDKAQDRPDSPATAAKGEPQSFKTSKDVFKLYTSTALDTREIKVPWKTLTTIGVCLLLILVAALYIWKFSGLSPETEAVSSASLPAPVAVALQGEPGRTPFQVGNAALPARDASWYVPRNPYDPSSAPKYDHLTQPTDFPRIAACIDSAGGCKCFSQQATRIYLPSMICKSMVKQGWFDDWKTGRQRGEQVFTGENEQRIAYRPHKKEPAPSVNEETVRYTVVGTEGGMP